MITGRTGLRSHLYGASNFRGGGTGAVVKSCAALFTQIHIHCVYVSGYIIKVGKGPSMPCTQDINKSYYEPESGPK